MMGHAMARHTPNTNIAFGNHAMIILILLAQRHQLTVPHKHMVSINNGAPSLTEIHLYAEMCNCETVLLQE